MRYCFFLLIQCIFLDLFTLMVHVESQWFLNFLHFIERPKKKKQNHIHLFGNLFIATLATFLMSDVALLVSFRERSARILEMVIASAWIFINLQRGKLEWYIWNAFMWFPIKIKRKKKKKKWILFYVHHKMYSAAALIVISW